MSFGREIPQVVCFNCGDFGHYSSVYGRLKICFICLEKDHVSNNCLEWKKP